MEQFAFAALFILGTALGSFLGVAVSRYDPDRPLFSGTLRGRSRCDSCGKTLRPLHLIPVLSFLFLRGRCGACGSKIPSRDFFVEILSGAIVAGVPAFLASFFNIPLSQFLSGGAEWWQYGFVALWTAVFLAWLAMVCIDMRHYLIPDEFHLIFAVLGIAAAAILVGYRDDLFPFRESFLKNYALVFSPFSGIIAGRVLGFFASGFLFLALFFMSKGKGMGMGDVKLAFSSGILLGWPDVGLAIIVSFIFGGIVSAALFLSGKRTMKDRVPFAPFFVMGSAITFFFGHALIEGYFSIFGL